MRNKIRASKSGKNPRRYDPMLPCPTYPEEKER